MPDIFKNESMLDVFIFESIQLIEKLEKIVISSEKMNKYNSEAINEIFRIMHTIKGSSAMMLFNNISTLAHSIEDLFFLLREDKPAMINCSEVSDLVLDSVDFIKVEIEKIRNGDAADGDCLSLLQNIKDYIALLKQYSHAREGNDVKYKPVSSEERKYYISPDRTHNISNAKAFKAVIFFDEGCDMENIRAYTIINNLRDISDEVHFIPEDVIEDDSSIEVIRREGFQIYFRTIRSHGEIDEFLRQTAYLKDLKLLELHNDDEFEQFIKRGDIVTEKAPVIIPQLKDNGDEDKGAEKVMQPLSQHMSVINVNVSKLDILMDMVGELVISEAMVTQNPDLKSLTLDNFQKAVRQHRKIINELQDMVMSIRMIPVSGTFHKMERIIRDMSRKLKKDVELVISGEDTEVDKKIIEHISDPLMHLIRNAIDHGIETPEERVKTGKTGPGKIMLEARNSGGEVWIIIHDNGRGLAKEKILEKAIRNGLLKKPEKEMTDKEIFSLIFIPGFSTNDNVTEFSGRGVGMDVVLKNVEAVGGTTVIDSVPGLGTTITLKIPLTLAIIDGMNIKVGSSIYTVPITSIRESFKAKDKDLVTDPDGNEMIMVRGQCHKILRLHDFFNIKTEIMQITDGIILMIENKSEIVGVFADELLGQQQVVVKALPNYIKRMKSIKGLAGCTLLGDGSISLILDTAGL